MAFESIHSLPFPPLSVAYPQRCQHSVLQDLTQTSLPRDCLSQPQFTLWLTPRTQTPTTGHNPNLFFRCVAHTTQSVAGRKSGYPCCFMENLEPSEDLKNNCLDIKPSRKVVFHDPYRFKKRTEPFVAAEAICLRQFAHPRHENPAEHHIGKVLQCENHA